MKDDVIYLITRQNVRDKTGVIRQVEEPRPVFCQIASASMTEFFAGGKNGLKPEKRFLVFIGDYKGEDEIKYRDSRYSVYRTYEDGDYIELYAERKSGVLEDGE